MNKSLKKYNIIPCNFTFVDIQTSFGHVSHASLGLLRGKGVEVVNKRCLISDLKVPNAAVTLRTHSCSSMSVCELYYQKWETIAEFLYNPAHLSTQVDYVGVGVIEGQQNSITGVHLLNTYWLIHVFLETQN